MSSSTYRNQINRLQKEIAKFRKDIGKESKDIADASRRIGNAKRSISHTTSESSIRSKLREIERHENTIARAEKKRADLENKIARKTVELNRTKENLLKEEEKEAKKAQKEDQKQHRAHTEAISMMDRHIEDHDQRIFETEQAIKQMQQPVDNITVLFLASNPLDQAALQLDEEIRAIEEMIRKSEHRDSVKLVSKWAVRPADVLQGLNEHSPHVVHISGHGSAAGDLVFQDENGKTKLVSVDAIVQLMVASTGSIRFVFFNSCHSSIPAEAVADYVEAAIGMNTAIGDHAARLFASQFYSAIGFGKSVKVAFDQAKALLMMEGIPEEDTPELYAATGLNPEEIILVTPPQIS